MSIAARRGRYWIRPQAKCHNAAPSVSRIADLPRPGYGHPTADPATHVHPQRRDGWRAVPVAPRISRSLWRPDAPRARYHQQIAQPDRAEGAHPQANTGQPELRQSPARCHKIHSRWGRHDADGPRQNLARSQHDPAATRPEDGAPNRGSSTNRRRNRSTFLPAPADGALQQSPSSPAHDQHRPAKRSRPSAEG